MLKLHGKGYRVLAVNIPFSHKFVVLPPLAVAALTAAIFVSGGIFTLLAARTE
jgi:hypothetical protein